jgi:hypothetical protein
LQKEAAVVAKVTENKGYVPPPPAAGPKIPAPAGMPKAKEFPISTGAAPPASMSFPNIQSAAPVAAQQDAGAPAGGIPSGEPANVEVNDGFTPEERRKNQLQEDPDFKKYLMMKRMKIPLANIRAKIRDTEGGKYTKADIDLFADNIEIAEANHMMI